MSGRGQVEPGMSLERFQAVMEQFPFHNFLGLKVEEIRPGYARMRLPYRPEFVGDVRRPALHGGVISFLMDTCGGSAVWASGDASDKVATIDLRVDYLRPAPPRDLVAVAEVRLLGNRVGNAAVTIYAADDMATPLAEGRGVYNIRKG
ncbi:MAG: PaaI family thioesterase [Desulfovibrionaceae bacterium]